MEYQVLVMASLKAVSRLIPEQVSVLRQLFLSTDLYSCLFTSPQEGPCRRQSRQAP